MSEQLKMWESQKSDDWNWKLEKLKTVPKINKIVFSCFACGGGSTMGYKLSGYDVLGCVEIDKKMNEIYVKNHNPKYNYLMDIRKFNEIPNEELPQELFNLDILDGSPPCTPFSMAGDREKTWGKNKKFREGQQEQTLDDLSFVFIETVKKLQPKIMVMENVKGILLGESFEYVKKIYKQLNEAGYYVNHYLLKSENMGVPQTRHRVFFVANRIGKTDLDLSFDYQPVTYGEIKSGNTRKLGQHSDTYKLLQLATDSDKSIGDVNLRVNNKLSGFQSYIINDNSIIPTIRAKPDIIDKKENGFISKETIIRSQTFPEDYDFIRNTFSNISYVCGMSVPPIIIKRISQRIYEQWLKPTITDEQIEYGLRERLGDAEYERTYGI